MIKRLAAVALAIALSVGCVSFPDAPQRSVEPAIAGEAIISADGARLGLTKWLAADPVAALVAVHGMNDYAGRVLLCRTLLGRTRNFSLRLRPARLRPVA